MSDIIARIEALLANTPQGEIEEFEVTRCLRECRDEIIAARACAEMMLQGTGQRLAESMAERVINGQTVGAWIPVSERLPEDDQQCLTVDKDGVQRVARFDAIGDGERHSWYEEQEWKSVYPVAWMPLPEPPEVK